MGDGGRGGVLRFGHIMRPMCHACELVAARVAPPADSACASEPERRTHKLLHCPVSRTVVLQERVDPWLRHGSCRAWGANANSDHISGKGSGAVERITAVPKQREWSTGMYERPNRPSGRVLAFCQMCQQSGVP